MGVEEVAEQWERQTGESYQAFTAFQTYLTTAERSYSKVARDLHRTKEPTSENLFVETLTKIWQEDTS